MLYTFLMSFARYECIMSVATNENVIAIQDLEKNVIFVHKNVHSSIHNLLTKLSWVDLFERKENTNLIFYQTSG